MSHRYPRWVDGTWVRKSHPLWPIIYMSRGRPVFPMSNYIEDPSHAGFVLSFVDVNNPNRRLTQATTTAQVALPTKHSDFNGALTASFTGSQTYVANDSPSNYAFTSDGTGMSALFPVTVTTVTGTHSFFCTTSAAGSRGLACYHTTTTARSSVEKTGTSVYPDSAVATLAINTPTYLVVSHGTSRSPQYDLRSKSSVTSSGSYASSAESGDPTHALRLGSNAGPSLLASMRTPLLAFSSGYSAQEFEDMQKTMLRFYGLSP